MPLISLATAKDHLGIKTTDRDGDITLKLGHAQQIVLDYLKARLSAIDTISVASPAVITTTVPHGLVSGTSYTIVGTTTTPTVNGAQVVTVTSPTTFTVPVAVTVGQSTAAGTVGSVVWTDATLPGPVYASILLVLTHLVEHRGDDLPSQPALSPTVESLLMRSRDPALA
jgi:Flp pilus assembly protein TadG